MLADAYYQLQSLYQPDLEFQECYLYGTSTSNQRIEAWWGQLSKGIIFRWRNYFASLRTQGHFLKDNLVDQISLYAVYIPILRGELYNFGAMFRTREYPLIASSFPLLSLLSALVGARNWQPNSKAVREVDLETNV
ncbi:hypothetical protein BU23DRAFT_571086 [Bimuria novae-zelandiae CBS 107.79]|uniref:Integrase core domain-containing protein n=1 Tax=Bimuria novae-zelandiae CBS 107.79 TaxID=1447943 RepID=A0A6A5V1C7_9PLEO|nr:hypothetical protein BU23DRAFT_571086 [Bimuria novae-zelandiae CBS 107.79]